MLHSHRVLPLFGLLMAASGCAYDEGLLVQNLRGTVHIPVDALTRTIVSADGTSQEITDPRLIGPVYLGLYPFVHAANVVERFPHPEVGPQFQEGVPGDTYPYGGTTIGDLRFACFEFLSCKVISGRYQSYQDLIDWFNLIEQPVTDSSGLTITNGDFLQQTCFDILNVTSDKEVRLIAEDHNEDEVIDEKDLDFVVDASGDYFVAPFTLWQQEFFWDKNQEADKGCEPGKDCTGFQLWGWVDSPSTVSYQYSTCNPAVGFQNTEYDDDFFAGSPYTDLLNFPATYIAEGDWVATEGYQWNDVYDQPELYIDFEVQ